MTVASLTASLTDRGLGLSAAPAVSPVAVVGCSSSGTVATPTECLSREVLISTFGYGPMVEDAAKVMELTGAPVVVCRAETGTAGAAGSVTRTGTGSDSDAWALTVTGDATDAYDVRVLVTRYGATLAAATAAVRISLDGGQTYQPEVPVPTSGILTPTGTGLTLTFDDGTAADEAFAGDVYSFATSAPVWSTATLATALAALNANTAPAHEIVLVSGPINATSHATVKTAHDASIAASRHKQYVCSVRDQSSGESVATWVGVIVGASPGLAGATMALGSVCAAYAQQDSAGVGGIFRRSIARLVVARLAVEGYARHPGRVRSGPLAGIRAGGLVHDFATSALSVLDTRGFFGAQSIFGQPGYYATATTNAASGSDFGRIQLQRIACHAVKLSTDRIAQEINEDFATQANGTLATAEADALDAGLTSHLRRELAGVVSDVSATVSRSQNLVTTETLAYRVRLQPRGYASAITLDLGYALGGV